MSTNNTIETLRNASELDPSFGDKGLARLQSPNPNYPNYESMTVATGPDNKIYVAGLAYKESSHSIYTLARLDENGFIDISFGEQGYFSDFFTNFPSNFYCDNINFLNGKIVLSGLLIHRENGSSRLDKGVSCILPSGKIDENFADHGKFIFRAPRESEHPIIAPANNEDLSEKARLKPGNPPHSRVSERSIQKICTITNEHILLLHATSTGGTQDSFIIRLDHRGVLDYTFNGAGFVRVKHEIFNRLELSSLIVDDSGNYISSGNVRVIDGGLPDAIVLVKHHQDGRLDTTYQRGGFLFLSSENPGHHFVLEKTVKQPNNRVLCAGTVVDPNSLERPGLLISREADGSSNIQFNKGNPVLTAVSSSRVLLFNTDFQPDGSFLATAVVETDDLSSNNYGIARFLHDGTHDKSFGNGEGWLNYIDSQHFRQHTSVITNKGVVISVEFNNGGVFDSALARGLLP
ncbi:delta-60 repeat domain-containing protein|uniref:delta-60 repeat domain-containing protein n=1 Tax=Pseudomonas sp. SbOxS1 TaxID=2723884 RepID=UPI0015D28D5F|nr:delta-60 repeat domain-containing protein [Pseudomonas sp. SbOxS1]NYU05237.1 delta-60 repeat domain-containing protein [Pseudomonas sp. SbOxS1]